MNNEQYYKSLTREDFLNLYPEGDSLLKMLCSTFYKGYISHDEGLLLTDDKMIEFESKKSTSSCKNANFIIHKTHRETRHEEPLYILTRIENIYLNGNIYIDELYYHAYKSVYDDNYSISRFFGHMLYDIDKEYEKFVYREFFSGFYKSVKFDFDYDAINTGYLGYSLTPLGIDASNTGLTNELLKTITNSIMVSTGENSDLTKWYIVLRRSEWDHYLESNEGCKLTKELDKQTNPVFQHPIFKINIILIENESIAANHLEYDNGNPICPIFSIDGYGFCTFLPKTDDIYNNQSDQIGETNIYGKFFPICTCLEGIEGDYEYKIRVRYNFGFLTVKMDSTKFAFVTLKNQA